MNEPDLNHLRAMAGAADAGANLLRPQRLDPVGCGCTDCCTGYSVPLDTASVDDLELCIRGGFANATGQSYLSLYDTLVSRL